MTRSLMVTGAAGFIGANFVYHWVEANPEDTVVAYDALTYAGNRASLTPLEASGQLHFVQGDICDGDLVRRTLDEFQVDTLVHFAAESHVDRSISGPDAFIRTNLVGTHTLLAAARARWLAGSGQAHRFHHVSTDEVFGSLAPQAPAFTETLRYEPNSPYSASKAASDHLARAWGRTYGLDVVVTNCSNNYGPRQHPEKLIPTVILCALHGAPIPPVMVTTLSARTVLVEAFRYVMMLPIVGLLSDLIFSPMHRLAHHPRLYKGHHKELQSTLK